MEESESDEDDEGEGEGKGEREGESEGEEEGESEGEEEGGVEPGGEEHENASTELKKNRENDKRKGKAVSRQIVSVFIAGRSVGLLTKRQAIWDALLEARIRMQKAVTAANTLPKVRPPSLHQRLKLTGTPAVRYGRLHAAARMQTSLGQDAGRGSTACGRARRLAGGEHNMHPNGLIGSTRI